MQLLRGVETALDRLGWTRIAGVDEAGRGCLAGPVVAAAVIPSRQGALPGVDDSKALKPEARERLAGLIRQHALAWSVAAVSARDIDRINILEATRLAMRQALDGLQLRPDAAIIDAVPLEAMAYPCLAMVKGDRVSYAIACASILAKVERDRMMTELDRSYPQYGFAGHKGYGSEEHRAALERYGPSPIHRLTFHSVVPRDDGGRPWR